MSKVLSNRECPRCGITFTGYPALSRRDNHTNICPDCGADEAFNDYLPFEDISILNLAKERNFMIKIGKSYDEWLGWKKRCN